MTDDLKPCPFCGSDAVHNSGGNSRYGRFWWTVGCNDCGVYFSDREKWEGSNLDPAYGPKECFSRWNTRPAPKVKPLVWRENNFLTGRDLVQKAGFTAFCDETSGYDVVDGRWCRFAPSYGQATDCGSDEAAKAAAQADYEARILSALEF